MMDGSGNKTRRSVHGMYRVYREQCAMVNESLLRGHRNNCLFLFTHDCAR